MTTAVLNNDQAAALLGVTPGTLKFWRHKGYGPRFIKHGTSKGAKVSYDPADIQAWNDERKFKSTTEYSAAARASVNARNTHMPPPRGTVARPWEKTTA